MISDDDPQSLAEEEDGADDGYKGDDAHDADDGDNGSDEDNDKDNDVDVGVDGDDNKSENENESESFKPENIPPETVVAGGGSSAAAAVVDLVAHATDATETDVDVDSGAGGEHGAVTDTASDSVGTSPTEPHGSGSDADSGDNVNGGPEAAVEVNANTELEPEGCVASGPDQVAGSIAVEEDVKADVESGAEVEPEVDAEVDAEAGRGRCGR